MSIFDDLKKPIKVDGENIDPRYFEDNGDGTYTLTQTMIYNIVRDAMNFYKEQVFSLDSECLYHTEKLAEFKDTWQEKLNNDQRELKYGPQLKELEKRKRDWRQSNIDKCDTRAGGPDLGDIDELRFFAGYSPEVKPTLSQAVSLYKFLKEYDNANGTTLKESLPQKPEVLMVKKEYAEEYKKLCDQWAEELGIPVVTEQVGTVERTKYTINQLRNANMKAVSANDAGLDEYVKGLITYITSSNKVDFKAKREECMTLIDSDFVMEFNENSKNLKADALSDNSIVIYTKYTEDASGIKFITISRDNPTDNYKYIMSINTADDNLRYSKTIATKADLRKALENTKSMIEDIDEFKKYIPDIENTIQSL